MIDRGARHLVLAGRRGETAESEEAVRSLRCLGAEVVVAKTDVADAGQVARLLSDMREKMPPLRGIVHAAAVIEDGLMAGLDAARLDAVLGPKGKGAWNLHRQTLDEPLDFFVLFSSVVSVFGNAGQAAYASANAMLDALAYHRRALGLPATSINWGAVSDVGWLARHGDVAQRLRRQGIQGITSRQAMTHLGRFLDDGPIQVGVLRMDWRQWAKTARSAGASPRLAQLVQNGGAASGGDGRKARDLLLATNPSERGAQLETLLRGQVARILGTTPAKLDVERPLTGQGMDSLTAVEFQEWIERDLGVQLPSVELLREPTIAQLAARLLQGFAGEAETAPLERIAHTVAASAPRGDSALHVDVDQMADDEVDALLRKLAADREVKP
jgi:aryl carrier-like protein